MTTPTKEDWAKIHARAWKDAGYRDLLESDPRKALDQYASEAGKTFSKVLQIKDRPKDVPDHKLEEDDEANGPPACC